MNWKTIEAELHQACSEIQKRKGSLADGPLRSEVDFPQLLDDMAPIEKAALAGLEEWLQGRPFPRMSSPALFLLELRFLAACGLCQCLPQVQARCPEDRQEALRWLLLETHAASTQPVIDHTILDILSSGARE